MKKLDYAPRLTRVTQIAVATRGEFTILYALRSDGTIWHLATNDGITAWEREDYYPDVINT
jgi:hypothetical protein